MKQHTAIPGGRDAGAAVWSAADSQPQQKQKPGGGKPEGKAGAAKPQKLAKKGEALKEEMDELMEEIDEVLEENAEEFVKNYVQRGGQ